MFVSLANACPGIASIVTVVCPFRTLEEEMCPGIYTLATFVVKRVVNPDPGKTELGLIQR